MTTAEPPENGGVDEVGRRATSTLSERTPHKRTRSLLRKLAKNARVVIPTSMVVALLAHLGWLEGFETAALDTMLRLKPHRDAEHVVIVGVSDHDYETEFHGESPLDPERLRAVISAIRRGMPAVIGVDIVTAPLLRSQTEPAGEPWPPVVWALDSRSAEIGPGNGPSYGLALLPRDRDGVVRRHQRQFDDRMVNGRAGDSLPWAIAKAYCAVERMAGLSECERLLRADPHENLILNFSGSRYAFPIIDVGHMLQASRGPVWGTQRGPLFGKIVLLGALHFAARDAHITPLGEMPGVVLVGQAVESELEGTGIRLANEVAMLFMELVGGFLIVVFHHRFSFRTAFVLSIIGMPFIAGISSLVSFYSLGRWAHFTPVLVASLIHELYKAAHSGGRAPRDAALWDDCGRGPAGEDRSD